MRLSLKDVIYGRQGILEKNYSNNQFNNIFIDKNVCPNTYRELTEMKWFYNKDGLIAKNPKTKKPFNHLVSFL